MKVIRKIQKDIYYVGASDHRLERFENLFSIPQGVSYNSYLIVDEKTALLDTVDASVGEVFFEQIEKVLENRPLDYLVIHHLEPDHSAMIEEVLRRYPDTTLVINAKMSEMLKAWVRGPYRFSEVRENETLSLGTHTLKFVMAPMVHWPEVMVSYETQNRILFSADAFGTFGALSGNIFSDEMTPDESYYGEARRYYANIVGKYGALVQGLFKKLQGIDFQMIAPLHGPILRGDLSPILNRYTQWSTYQPESNDVVIFYSSMYQNTYRTCEDLAYLLAEKKVKNIRMWDVSKTEVSYLISEVFRCRTIVLATPTYNGGLFPKMADFLQDMKALNVQNRNFVLIENGSWAPMANKQVSEIVSSLKNVRISECSLTIRTKFNEDQLPLLEQMAEEIAHLQ